MSLSVSGVVRVTINLGALSAAARSFGVLNVAGDSNVINGVERLRQYSNVEAVASDFGTTAPETKAAELFFGQVPQPAIMYISRWFRTAASAFNDGGILTANEQALSNWTTITNGSFTILIDAVVHNLTSLDFSAATNLNGVASVITTALAGAGTCIWTGTNFEIISSSTGAGNQAAGTISLDTNPSYGVQASGTITLTGQPANLDTITIQGTVVTFVTGSPTGNQVQIGGTALITSANLGAFLQNSSDVSLSLMTYGTVALVTTATAKVFGVAGNAYTLVHVGANVTLSGATLAGGVASDTLTVNGTTITFVNANPSGNQVLVAATNSATSANLQAFLAASSDVNIAVAYYATFGNLTTVTFKLPGILGNSFTLAKVSSHITLSGATLSGGTIPSVVGYATPEGSGTDISAMLMLTSVTSQALIPGFNAETPVQCAAILANRSSAWYGLMFQASVQPTDDQSIDVSSFIEALDVKRIYGVTITNTNVLSALVTTDLASRMMASGFLRSFCQYSQNPYAIASFFGRAFSVNFLAQNSTITLMFKQEPGVTGEEIPQNQADVLKEKRCNVFVNYQNDTVIIQYGTMSGPAWFDEIHGLDWLQNAIQTAVFNVLYTSGKVPQTSSGQNQINNAISATCTQGDSSTGNGLIAPGIWNGPSFGSLVTGQYLKTGFYIFAPSVDLQAQSDRDARKAPPIQVAVKLAGAIQEVDVLITVNR